MILTDDIMFDALLRKDATFVGVFIAAVKSTGIFCRPTCTAKKPKRENVEFFRNTHDAIVNGYRPCKVCRPLETDDVIPEDIKFLIDEVNSNPANVIRDLDLRERGLEPETIRRWFKKNHGVTFQSYQRMIRIGAAMTKLKDGENVTDVAFDSGYESLSGFNESFKSLTGVSPSKASGKNIINIHRFESPLGPMFACATEEGLCLLEFSERRWLDKELKTISQLLNASIIHGMNNHLQQVEKEMNEYFRKERTEFTVPLLTPGTDFQQKVWKELQNIPYGSTRSYKEQSIALGQPSAVRAVANANGMNRIAVIIPCHRVIGEDGHLTGYGGGIWRKKWLLDLEGGINVPAKSAQQEILFR